MWMTVKEISALEGISTKSVRRKKDQFETRYDKSPNGGKDILMINWKLLIVIGDIIIAL